MMTERKMRENEAHRDDSGPYFVSYFFCTALFCAGGGRGEMRTVLQPYDVKSHQFKHVTSK